MVALPEPWFSSRRTARYVPELLRINGEIVLREGASDVAAAVDRDFSSRSIGRVGKRLSPLELRIVAEQTGQRSGAR